MRRFPGPVYGHRDVVWGRFRLLSAMLTLALFAISLHLLWQVRDQIQAYWDELRSEPLVEPTRLPSDLDPLPERHRAELRDRNGQLLALNARAHVLCADWDRLGNPEDTVRGIMRILPDADPAWLLTRLERRGGSNWLRYRVTQEQRDAFRDQGVAGITYCRVPERVYPLGAVTGHWLGSVEPDLSEGLAGVERAYNDLIRNQRQALDLTLDARIQHILLEELAASVATFSARGGYGVLMDVDTGEVLAMASVPTFDPSIQTNATDPSRFFSPLAGVYEHGSVMKLFSFAAALDLGLVNLGDRFDVTPPQTLNGVEVNDYTPRQGTLSLAECLQFSSNICSSQVAIALGSEQQQRYYANLGLTLPLDLPLGEVARPNLPEVWRPSTLVTQSFGYGMATTPLHVAAAGAALVNGGVYRPPLLLQQDPTNRPTGVQVFRPETSRTMRGIMGLSVTDGSGRRAIVPGLRVGGKTGTANKVGPSGYTEDRRLSSFLGTFPLEDPRYVLLVGVDEPRPLRAEGYATGGMVAAPLFANVVRRAMPLLNLTPNPNLLDAPAN